MKVGIVIAVHNGERFLAETIESVLSQDYQDWRMVIIDDGSIDHSLELAQKYCDSSRSIEVLSQECCGVSVTRNRGASALILAGAELLMFLDQDDVLLPNALSELVKSLRLNPRSAAAVGSIQPMDAQGQQLDRSSWLDRSTTWHIETYGKESFSSVSVRELMFACSIATPGCCLIRAHAFSQIGGFNTTLKMCEDWDFWLRLSVIGCLSRISSTTINYRYHDNNTHKVFKARAYAVARDKTRMKFLSLVSRESALYSEALEGFMASLLESMQFRKLEVVRAIKARNMKQTGRGVINLFALAYRRFFLGILARRYNHTIS